MNSMNGLNDLAGLCNEAFRNEEVIIFCSKYVTAI